MKGKRIISISVSAALLLMSVPLSPGMMPGNVLTASAENDEAYWEAYKNGGYGFTKEFDTESGTLTISGKGEMFDGYQIAATPFMDMKGLKKLVITDGVTNISNFAFSYCRELTSVTLPGSITGIGTSGFAGCSALTEIVLPDSVKRIGETAFDGCTALTGITIPDSVTEIDGTAFSGCEKLTIKGKAGSYAETFAKENDFVFESIGNAEPNATSGSCGENVIWTLNPDYYELTISGTGDMQDYTGGTASASASPFQALDFYTAEIQNGVTGIGDYAFADCKKLNWITISDSVTSIGDNAFVNCVKLEQINIPDSVTYIGAGAFDGCTRLNWVKIPDSVTEIGEGAFQHCTNLTEAIIPESVTKIGKDGESVSIFDGCSEDLKIIGVKDSAAEAYAEKWNIPFEEIEPMPTSGTCGENVTWKLEDKTLTISGTGDMTDYFAAVRNPPYYGMNYDTVVIEDGVTSIGTAAFFYSQKLQNVTILDSVTRIGGNAFSGCAELKDITIPNSVTSIGLGAFSDCTGLTEVTIPDSVTAIGSGAFGDCTNLETIVIPESVTDIGFTEVEGQTGKPVFSGCEKLTIKGVKGSTAEEYAKEFNIPFEAIEAQPQPKVYNGLKYMIEGDAVMIVGYTDDLPAVLEIPAEIDGKPVTGFSQFALSKCDKLKEVTLPDTITSSGMQTFWGCKNLEKVTLPSTLKGLYEASFAECTALKSVTIPDGCEIIGNLVFSGCTSLSEVNIPASVKRFEEPAFENTPWLEAKRAENPLVVVNGILIDAQTAKGEVTVPEGVTQISAWSVMDNKTITKLTLPKSLEKLDSLYSLSELTEVTFLNPDCEIPDDAATICNGRGEDMTPYFNGTIRGYTGSTAEAFAKKTGYKFESLGDAPSEPVKGDFNGDGAVTVADAVLLARFVSEDTTLKAEEISKILDGEPDQDADGLVTVLDVNAILKKLEMK